MLVKEINAPVLLSVRSTRNTVAIALTGVGGVGVERGSRYSFGV